MYEGVRTGADVSRIPNTIYTFPTSRHADLWSGMKDRPELVSSDRFHPNDAGHRVIADLYWMQIAPRLGATHAASGQHCNYDSFLAGRAHGLPANASARVP